MIFIYSIHFFELNGYIQKGAMLLDIRPYHEFITYHIPNSFSIHTLTTLPKHQPIIFICEFGHKAKAYAHHYRSFHYDCYYLEGGISRYLDMIKQQPYY